MSWKDSVWLTTVVPILGGFIAITLFSSPLRAVLDARRNGSIGDLNILPMILIVANCVSWIVYSFLINSWFLFVPNFAGFLIGLFLFLVTYGIGVPITRERDQLTAAAMVFAIALPILGAVERLVLDNEDSRKTLWGVAANVILFFFFLSPLSTISRVLRQRDSSSLTAPLCVMNIVNGTTWAVYGLVLSDAFIWVPNAVGALLGALQVGLCIVFPRRAASHRPPSQEGLVPIDGLAPSSEAVPSPSIRLNARQIALTDPDKL